MLKHKKQTGSGAHILLVENDAFLADIYEKNLVMEGFRVTRASSGERAEAILKKKGIDLALVSVSLPQMSGFDLLADIKKDKNTGNLPVILLSKLGSAEDVERAEALAADGYIIKTHFRPSEIVDKIKKTLLRS